MSVNTSVERYAGAHRETRPCTVPRMNRDSAIKQLGAVRAVVGAASWVAPRLSGKAFGLDSADNPAAPYLGRLFGARDVALAYGAMSTSGEDQDRWLVAGLGCDV